jgi:hypothetical protein
MPPIAAGDLEGKSERKMQREKRNEKNENNRNRGDDC